jgi:hypothetical protein
MASKDAYARRVDPLPLFLKEIFYNPALSEAQRYE